ncbi:hypothetical protein [Photobacterium aquimaris]|uniref:hypothetical protein n=1 Tax=Photobacterium aquimaris TaxID=512643 RepID=UPI000AC13219|nr:hypothetical protein [Photobacterium aquimaris]
MKRMLTAPDIYLYRESVDFTPEPESQSADDDLDGFLDKINTLTEVSGNPDY